MFDSKGIGNRFKKLVFLSLLFSTLIFSQDGTTGSTSLLEKPESNFNLLPSEKTDDIDLSFLNKPNENNKSIVLNNENFINPGDSYLKKLKKDSPLTGNMYLGDTYLGDVKTISKIARIVCRDFEHEDGDRVKILVNDNEVISNLLLKNQFFVLDLPLVQGFNKIDFTALNQGQSGPNTAELRVYDDTGAKILGQQWNLSTGSTATLIIVKEDDKLYRN